MRRLAAALALAVSFSAAAQSPQNTGDTPLTLAAAHLLDVIYAVTRDYITPVKEEALVPGCLAGMKGWLGARTPPLELPVASGQPQSGGYGGMRAVFAETLRRYPELAGQEKALIEACAKGMIAGLGDRLSEYMDSERFKELQVGPRGGIAGTGLELGNEGGRTIIVSTVDDTPAAAADLASGDELVAVDGTPTARLGLVEVVRLLRGSPGSTVVLTVRRDGVAEPMRRELKRVVIRLRTVTTSYGTDGVLVLRLSQFSSATAEDLGRALRTVRAEHPVGIAGVVLDLRDNVGGILTVCVEVATAFLPEKQSIGEIRGRDEATSRKLTAESEARPHANPLRGVEWLKGLPVVVLVNRRTASGAELLAAALQGHRGARLLGEPTYGAGTVQTIFPVRTPGIYAGLKLTTHRLHRWDGALLEGAPLAPDVTLTQADVARPPKGAEDRALAQARKMLAP